MTDQELLKTYTELVPFLAKVCGSGCEIVVHDITNPEHSLIAIENNLSGRCVGDPLTDLARSIQEQEAYTHAAFISNYQGKGKGKEFLSSTYFIKNEGRLIGLLCFNKDMDAVQNVSSALHALLSGFNLYQAPQSEYQENLDSQMVNLLQKRVTQLISESGVLPTRLSREEKVRIVHKLNEEGLLNVKGAVAEIAERLSVSVPTVYRYLNKGSADAAGKG